MKDDGRLLIDSSSRIDTMRRLCKLFRESKDIRATFGTIIVFYRDPFTASILKLAIEEMGEKAGLITAQMNSAKGEH